MTPKRWTKNLSDIRDRVSLGGPQKGLAEAGMPLSKPYGTDVLVPHCRLQSSASKPLLHFHSNIACSLLSIISHFRLLNILAGEGCNPCRGRQ